jgi:hypothetical protein
MLAVAGVDVLYARGASDWALRAVPGRSKIESWADGNEATIVGHTQDFIVLRADFAETEIGSPRRGDVIRWPRDDGTVDVFEVLPLGAATFSQIDAYREGLRINCRFTRTEASP